MDDLDLAFRLADLADEKTLAAFRGGSVAARRKSDGSLCRAGKAAR
jgi:hypothetical protein